MVVDICGIGYAIIFGTADTDAKLVDCDGYTDCTTKKIVIAEFCDDDNLSVQNINVYRENIIRHEIIHAFAYESGIEKLGGLPEELLVQWFAMQLPKINSAVECVVKELTIWNNGKNNMSKN